MVKPCSKELKCDVALSAYTIRDVGEYKNFCDRPMDQRPLPEEVIGDIAEHLTTMYLKRCEHGKLCLYEGSTPSGGFPNSWDGATYCTSEMAVLKNNEIHTWDRGYDDDGKQASSKLAGIKSISSSPAFFSPCLWSIHFSLPQRQARERRVIHGSLDGENMARRLTSRFSSGSFQRNIL